MSSDSSNGTEQCLRATALTNLIHFVAESRDPVPSYFVVLYMHQLLTLCPNVPSSPDLQDRWPLQARSGTEWSVALVAMGNDAPICCWRL